MVSEQQQEIFDLELAAMVCDKHADKAEKVDLKKLAKELREEKEYKKDKNKETKVKKNV